MMVYNLSRSHPRKESIPMRYLSRSHPRKESIPMRYLSGGIMTNKKGVYSWGLRMVGMAVFFKWYREKTKKSLGLFLEMIWAIWALWSIMTYQIQEIKRYQGTIEIPKAWRLILIKDTEKKQRERRCGIVTLEMGDLWVSVCL